MRRENLIAVTAIASAALAAGLSGCGGTSADAALPSTAAAVPLAPPAADAPSSIIVDGAARGNTLVTTCKMIGGTLTLRLQDTQSPLLGAVADVSSNNAINGVVITSAGNQRTEFTGGPGHTLPVAIARTGNTFRIAGDASSTRDGEPVVSKYEVTFACPQIG